MSISKCWADCNERGMNRGTDVSRTRFLDIGHRSDGICWGHDRNGFAVLYANGIFCVAWLFEVVRTYIHLNVLGVHDRMLYRFFILVCIRHGQAFLILSLLFIPTNTTGAACAPVVLFRHT